MLLLSLWSWHLVRYTAAVSKETEQSHGERSSPQGSLSHGAFWGEQVRENHASEGEHTSALPQQARQAAECSRGQKGRGSTESRDLSLDA